jgi:hypothetical protein
MLFHRCEREIPSTEERNEQKKTAETESGLSLFSPLPPVLPTGGSDETEQNPTGEVRGIGAEPKRLNSP